YSYRTRVLDYIWARLPIVCTRGDAIGDLVQAHGLGCVLDYGDVDGLVDALLAVLDDPGGREAYRERFRDVAAGMTWERALEPVLRFCAAPHPAADRIADAPDVDLAAAPRRNGLSRGVSLVAPAPPA